VEKLVAVTIENQSITLTMGRLHVKLKSVGGFSLHLQVLQFISAISNWMHVGSAAQSTHVLKLCSNYFQIKSNLYWNMEWFAVG